MGTRHFNSQRHWSTRALLWTATAKLFSFFRQHWRHCSLTFRTLFCARCVGSVVVFQWFLFCNLEFCKKYTFVTAFSCWSWYGWALSSSIVWSRFQENKSTSLLWLAAVSCISCKNLRREDSCFRAPFLGSGTCKCIGIRQDKEAGWCFWIERHLSAHWSVDSTKTLW